MMHPPHKLESARWNGRRVGLFGGTFNPPHDGHVHASEIALKYLGLDAIWWLVTPGNPLKPKANLPPLEERTKACQALTHNPRILVSSIESAFGTSRTYDTVLALERYFPTTEFVWCSGMDIPHEFHRWYKWQALASRLPLAFVGRPTRRGTVRASKLRLYSHKNSFLRHGGRPALEKGRIYWIFEEPLNSQSSTLLRQHSPNLRIPT